MQQLFEAKRFVINRIGATTLAFGILASGALSVAGIGATGNLPWTAGNDSPTSTLAPAISTARQYYAAKELRQEASELDAASRAANAAAQWQAPPIGAAKEVHVEREELHASVLALRTQHLETMLRYVERKEAQSDALR